MKNLILLVLITVAGALYADSGTRIAANSSDYQAGLGDGWDPAKQILKGRCLVGVPVSQGTSGANVSFDQKVSYDQLEKELGFGAAGRARYGVIEASAAAKFLSNSKSDAYSISATYTGTYEFKNLSLSEPKVSPEMEPIRNNDDKWEQACGFEYIQQLKLGAKIYFTIRIDFSSEEEKKSFEANFNIQGPMWGASGELKTASSHFSKRTKVTIATLQVGGEVDKISQIFGGPDNLVKCSLGEFDRCGKVLADGLEYATQEFPKQIAKETLTAQLGTGPVVISYLTKPFATAGIFPRAAPEVRLEVKRARLKLNQLLTQFHQQWIFANRYSDAGARRLSGRQMRLILEAKKTLDDNLRKIAEAAQVCYDDPTLNCIDETNRLNVGGDNELVQVDPTIFVIENETFAQFCDDGMSPGPYASPALKETIQALLKLAKEIRVDAFIPPAPEVPIDECFISGNVFLGLRDLDASGRGIADLRPLMEFTQLERLILSNNKLETLAPFELPFVKNRGGFSRLRELRLDSNRISELGPLKVLPALEILILRNNRIKNADALLAIPTLTRVDLRNNSQDLVLKLPAPAVVLTADHGNSVVFSDIPRLTYMKRFAHQASLLPSGDIVIVGTMDPIAATGAELFERSSGKFSRLTSMHESRVWHSMTPVKDGRFLIAGGLGSRTAEWFDPRTNGFELVRGEMSAGRAAHTATPLPDGRVLITGGWRFASFGAVSASAEIFDPATEKFALLPNGLSVPRAGHTATVLKDGRVLFLGGHSDRGTTNTVDIYDPVLGVMMPLPRRMNSKRAFHTATLLQDGQVLITGGTDGESVVSSAELFDPVAGNFRLVTAKMEKARVGHQATLLSTGVVVLSGGSDGPEALTEDATCRHCMSSVELFDPQTEDFTLTNNSLTSSRVFHTVTPTGGDRFLVVGGLGGDRAAETAEIMAYSAPNRSR